MHSASPCTHLEDVVTLRWSLHTDRRIRKESLFIAVVLTLILLATLHVMSLNRSGLSNKSITLLPSRFPVTLSLKGSSLSGESLSKGRFLVASRQLRDPNFAETVILLIDYGLHGASGLVINRPTELRLYMVLPEIKGVQKRTDIIYIGGPVARNHLLLLIRSANQPEKSHPVLGDIHVSTSRAVLQTMIDDAKEGERFRVYAGYAGWAPGQLDREVLRGDWHIFQADAETIFDKKPLEIWPELIRRSSDLWVRVQRWGRNME